MRYHTVIYYIMSATRDQFQLYWVSSHGCNRHSIIKKTKMLKNKSIYFSAFLFFRIFIIECFYTSLMRPNKIETGRGLWTWCNRMLYGYRMMVVIVFMQNFQFYLSVMLEADPS